MASIHTTPPSTDRAPITGQGIVASARKLLNPIAAHCLSITPTQKDGSEYSRKDRKMIR